MKTIARGSRVESSFSNVPGAWAELKAIALMMPHPRVIEKPIDPGWIFECGKHLELDLDANGWDHHLLPFAIAMARAPLPAHWYPLNRNLVTTEDMARNPKWFLPPPSEEFIYKAAAQRKSISGSLVRTPTMPTVRRQSSLSSKHLLAGAAASPSAAPEPVEVDSPTPLTPSRLTREQLDVYENPLTRERKHGHPGVALVLPVVRGMQARAARALKPSPTDGWVQFADADGDLYFYSFRERMRTSSFPTLSKGDVPHCVLPARRLEPSAELLCKVGESMLPSHLSYSEALREARKLCFEPRKAARAIQLASNPCPLDEILIYAQYLGLAPAEHSDFMFLVDAMLAPELPCGWLARSSPGMAEGSEYYWNMMVGWAQWEHPQVSLLTGVANNLKKRLRDHEAMQKMAEDARQEVVAVPGAPAAVDHKGSFKGQRSGLGRSKTLKSSRPEMPGKSSKRSMTFAGGGAGAPAPSWASAL